MEQTKQTHSRIFQQTDDQQVKFLLCVDMDSHQIYTINLRTHKIQFEKDVPPQYLAKAEKDIEEIQKVLQLPSSQWNWQCQRASRYRRRQISEYLLHKIINQEPTYLAQSSMSDAFSNVSSVKLIVDISEYISIEDNLPDQYYKDLNPLSIELNVDLVTCADEVIKKIHRAVFNLFQKRLKTKSEANKFILQISGCREYLSGNYSILSYDRVRMSLRGIQYLELNLSEVPITRRVYENFPPIFERTLHYDKETQQWSMTPIPWERFIDVPPLLFYAPYSPQNEAGKKQVKVPESELKPRVFMKEKCLEFTEIRKKQLDQQIPLQILYSGECDFQFSIRIAGIINIDRILILDDKDHDEFKRSTQAYKRRATYNGVCSPKYITKESAKQEEQHNTSKKKPKTEDEVQKKKSFLKFSKSRDPDPNHVKLLSKSNFSPHMMQHGGSGSAHMDYLQSRYELDFSPYLISIQIILMYGQTPLTKYSTQQTPKIPFRKLCRWDSQFQFSGMKISQLPMELRMCFNVIMHSSSAEEQIIASTMTEVFDENGKFKQGRLELNLWPFYKIDSRLSCMNEYYGAGLPGSDGQQYYSKLIIGMPQFTDEMFWSLRDEKSMVMLGFPPSPFNRAQQLYTTKKEDHSNERRGTYNNKIVQKDWRQIPNTDEIAKLDRLLRFDPLVRGTYTDFDKYILLKCRNHYRNLPQAFPIFLCAINWSDPEQVKEVYHMMKIWTPLPQDDALPLLDAHISDESVRYYATRQIGKYKDDELVLFMLELTQALMFEQTHFSPLGEMLIERSVMNPWVVGHELFWQLRSQLHIQPSFPRYSLILEQLLMLSGGYRYELMAEVLVNDEIMEVAENIKLENNSQKRVMDMRQQIAVVRTKFGPTFQYAIDPRMNNSEFLIEKCSILNSKKLPLWLTMKSAEVKDSNYVPQNVIKILTTTIKDLDILKMLKRQKEERKPRSNDQVKIIFKCGDDIRQDLLTLQLLKIMDKIWLDFGLDFRMKPYKVISTLDQVGMIEVVLNSETTSQIHEDAGKFGALKDNSILDYLKKFNKNNMDNAIENFLRSCAGYCVATYILGIGDRHSGNIMLTQFGHLFHIDFGHFLGNFKTKLGFKRERAPFVFTEEMAYVMGGVSGNGFLRFQDLCTKAYNQVRKHGHLLINIFLMMLSAGMPELQEISDIDYLKEKLQLDIGDQQAEELFKKEIYNSLNDKWRKFDNFIHNLKRT